MSYALPLTPVDDREPVKIMLLRPRGTLYWGGAGLDGPYIKPQMQAFRDAGIKQCFVGLTNSATKTYSGDRGTIMDAIRSGLFIRYRDDDEWTISSGMADEAEQFNLMGYSYGSLLAAQTAWSYANRTNVVIDHLVLIGSPIDGEFLRDLKSHRNIRRVVVINLTQHGDPLYAGMTETDLVAALPRLGMQFKGGKGEGHFYYAQVVQDSPVRWKALAQQIVAEGVR